MTPRADPRGDSSDRADPPGDAPRRAVSRRSILAGGIGAGAGVLAGVAGVFGAQSLSEAPRSRPAPPSAGEPVPARGRRQAGVDRPATPQRTALIVVADVAGDPDRTRVRELLAAAGEAVDAVTDPSGGDPLVVPDGPGDLSVTVGIGPRLVASLDPALPGAEPLPAFAGDEAMDPRFIGGDLLIAVYSSDVSVLAGVAAHVLAAIPGATRRWAQSGVRGAGEGGIARNPLGYHDGIIVPRTREELAANVWIGAGPAADGTVAVIRRLRLDVERFHAQPVPAQDRVIGRRRGDGAPLSGGGPTDQVNLTAKSPEGEYRVPLRSHARAAHPSFTGSALMLRRGYSFSNPVGPGEPADDGLLFMCFQHSLDTFVRTQRRLDESDDLMSYVTATASASFLIVPGRRDGSPLGHALAP